MDIAGYVGNPTACIILYKNVWDASQNFSERLEACLADSEDEYFCWGDATVGDIVEMKDYRDCHDFKIGGTHGEELPYFKNLDEGPFADLKAVYNEVMEGIHACVDHYSKTFNIGDLEYFEAPNFVKYTEGQHFMPHPDCGFSYTCTTSVVSYLNTCGVDYEGGELVWNYQDIKFTPEKNDVVVFPSNYPYVHESKPITSGTKYSCVVMYDYNDRNHKNMDGPPQISEYGSQIQQVEGQETLPDLG
jgi:predicted 2-oxoglutarate/Fe(II)-dependent dioxygenase YbiX